MHCTRDKSRQIGIDISFAIYDEFGLPVLFRRYGDAGAFSTKIVPCKAYTSAVMFMPTEELSKLTNLNGPLRGIENNDPKITTVSGGYPLFVDGHCIGGIGMEEDVEMKIKS